MRVRERLKERGREGEERKRRKGMNVRICLFSVDDVFSPGVENMMI